MHQTGRITSLTVPAPDACLPPNRSCAKSDSPEKGFSLPLMPARHECPVTHSSCWDKPPTWIGGSSQSNCRVHQASNGVPIFVSDQGFDMFIMASMALNTSVLPAIAVGSGVTGQLKGAGHSLHCLSHTCNHLAVLWQRQETLRLLANVSWQTFRCMTHQMQHSCHVTN